MNIVILAAGLGKRMKSKTPKVLHPILGRPLIRYVTDLAYSLSPEKVVAVIARDGTAIRRTVPQKKTVYVVQDPPRGTGDAAMKGLALIGGGPVLILSGDAPYLKKTSVDQLVAQHHRRRSDLTVVCAELEDPQAYGRVIIGAGGQIQRIVEHTDATPEQKKVKLVNGGMYLADAIVLKRALDRMKPDNKQGEYYLTDAVKIIIAESGRVFPFIVNDPNEVLGINSKQELAEMRRLIRDSFYRQLMAAGVVIEDPNSTTIDVDVVFGQGVVVKPNTVIEGGSSIGDNCEIGPFAWIRNYAIGQGRRVAFKKLVKEA